MSGWFALGFTLMIVVWFVVSVYSEDSKFDKFMDEMKRREQQRIAALQISLMNCVQRLQEANLEIHKARIERQKGIAQIQQGEYKNQCLPQDQQ